MLKIAFYKGTHKGLAGVYNRLVRSFDSGKYSHCELIFSDGMSASSSFMDGGVRFKQIIYDPNNWDIIELPNADENAAREWFIKHEGLPYDIRGNLKLVFILIPQSKNGWFCSEAVAAALRMVDSWRYSPNALYAIIKYTKPPHHI